MKFQIHWSRGRSLFPVCILEVAVFVECERCHLQQPSDTPLVSLALTALDPGQLAIAFLLSFCDFAEGRDSTKVQDGTRGAGAGSCKVDVNTCCLPKENLESWWGPQADDFEAWWISILLPKSWYHWRPRVIARSSPSLPGVVSPSVRLRMLKWCISSDKNLLPGWLISDWLFVVWTLRCSDGNDWEDGIHARSANAGGTSPRVVTYRPAVGFLVGRSDGMCRSEIWAKLSGDAWHPLDM